MIHFVRTKNNDTIADIEVVKHTNDLHSAIDILAYTEVLLDIDQSKVGQFSTDFQNLSEIKGEWFETNHGHTSMDEFVRDKCQEIVNRWSDLGLVYVTD